MALTGNSTETAARDQYLANSDWHGNASKARLRKEAIDWYFTHPQAMSAAGRSISMNQQAMARELAQLDAFIASESGNNTMITRGISSGRAW